MRLKEIKTYDDLLRYTPINTYDTTLPQKYGCKVTYPLHLAKQNQSGSIRVYELCFPVQIRNSFNELKAIIYSYNTPIGFVSAHGRIYVIDKYKFRYSRTTSTILSHFYNLACYNVMVRIITTKDLFSIIDFFELRVDKNTLEVFDND